MKKLLMPPVVLTLVCLIVTAALVITYNFTLPYIDAAKALAADNARSQVFPGDYTYRPYTGQLPPQVLDIYLAYEGESLAGCIVTAVAQGFGGDFTVMSGYDLAGGLTGLQVTGHSETPGLGTKVADAGYLQLYQGKTVDDYAAVDAISGVTISSNALKEALGYAFAASAAVMEGVQ